MTPPLFHLSFDCPACGKQWGEDARVRRDAACPRCGVVSLYTRARAVDPWPWPTDRGPQRPYPPGPDPAPWPAPPVGR
jgi:DNA-directed RNA polymerase subunit RPC12/RpoP